MIKYIKDELRMWQITFNVMFFFNGTTSSSGPRPPHQRGFTITLRDTQLSAGFLWTNDQPDAETSTWQHAALTGDRYPATSGIWNRNHISKQPRTHNLDRAASGTGWGTFIKKYCSRFTLYIYNNRNYCFIVTSKFF